MRQGPEPRGFSLNHEVAPPLAQANSSVGHRLFGGPPLAVLMRLVFVSLVVGALLMWLDIEPMDVVRGALRVFDRLWAMGFDAFGQVGRYVLAGAVIVVPVWFVARLLTLRGAR